MYMVAMVYDLYGIDEYPLGTNAVVAPVISYTVSILSRLLSSIQVLLVVYVRKFC